MARRITLQVASEQHEVLSCRFRFYHEIGHNGLPQSGLLGGDIFLEVESTERTDLLKWLTGGSHGYPTGHWQGEISGRIDIEDTREDTPLRRIEFSEAYIYDFCEQMSSDSPLPMTQFITISPTRLDINHTVRMDRRWPQSPGYWKKYVPEEKKVVPPKEPITYVTKVDGPKSGLPNETLAYSVANYSCTPTDSDRQEVKWQVKIGDKMENLPDKGETIKIKLKEGWEGKEIVVMAYLHSPDEEVSAKTKVKLEAVIVFVNGYWNSGESDLVSVPNTIQGSQTAAYKQLKKYIAENWIGTRREAGYWGGENEIKAFLGGKYTIWSSKEIALNGFTYIYYDGAGNWLSSGGERWNQGFDRHKTKASLINDPKLKNNKVVNDEGEQMKRIFVVTHSMGAAHAEGLLAAWKYLGLEVECVMHFAAADNRDFSVTFPSATWQINVSPDPVLAFKNMDDRISDYTQDFFDLFRKAYQKENRQMYLINGMRADHFKEYERNDLMGHYYTKAYDKWNIKQYF